jgi:hypothetical protein
MIGRVLEKAIMDLRDENSEKFDNNNVGSNVSRVFARI